MLVSLIFISLLLCRVCGWGRGVCSLFSVSWVLADPCGRGGVRERPGERTRSGGREPAKHPPPQKAPASAGTHDAVRPRWIPRSRPGAEPAGALRRLAVTSEVDARSLPPTVGMKPAGSISRGGWA